MARSKNSVFLVAWAIFVAVVLVVCVSVLVSTGGTKPDVSATESDPVLFLASATAAVAFGIGTFLVRLATIWAGVSLAMTAIAWFSKSRTVLVALFVFDLLPVLVLSPACLSLLHESGGTGRISAGDMFVLGAVVFVVVLHAAWIGTLVLERKKGESSSV